MSTKENYILVYLPNFDVYLKFLKLTYISKVKGIRKIEIINNYKIIGELNIDERFNIIKYQPTTEFELTYVYLINKYIELKKSNFRYGDWETNGISPTLFIFLEDFIEYLKEDIRDFKINILLNEEE